MVENGSGERPAPVILAVSVGLPMTAVSLALSVAYDSAALMILFVVASAVLFVVLVVMAATTARRDRDKP